jgi:TolB-like protein/DNA-binding winged helix-turn-helix (wHTH) protein/Tfp pilus assembly protein PilF
MSPPETTRPFRIGDWRLDPALDEISRDGRRIKLEPRMTRLLCCLAERPGEVVSLNTLLDRVWPGVVVSQSSVYQAIAQLRRELGDTEAEPRYIATVPRRGYRLVATVAYGDPAPSAANTGTPAPAAAGMAPAPPGKRKLASALVAAAVLVAAILAAVKFLPGPAQVASAAPAIAVLPFDDLSADASNEIFCEGLTEEVLNSLARVPKLRVIGRTSSARFADGSAGHREIGEALGVSHILEGSVRRTGNRVRVSAQLVSARDGFQVWSNSFDRPAGDTLGIQSQIARAVVDALALKLSPAADERLAQGPTAQVSAYDLYLLGRHQQRLRTPETLARAIEYHQAAIREDPGFALAWAGLADAEMARYYYDNQPLDEVAKRVQAAVDSALRLDPELAEAYAAWAVLLMEQWQTEEAIQALNRAIAINSNYGEAYLRLGAAYEYDGRPREALAAYDQVAVLDPLNTVLHVRRCLTLQNLGRYADAERACERGFELQPDIPNALWARGLNAFAQGDLAAAVGHYEAALARAPARNDIRAELAVIYLDLGVPERAAREIARLRNAGETRGTAMTTARYLLATGDVAGLRLHLSRLDLDEALPRERVDAAFFALAIGEPALASRIAGDALEPRPTLADDFRPGLYRTRWGVCEACTAGLLERRRGDVAAAAQMETLAVQHLDNVESNGHVWHGLHYLRAAVQAQSGDRDAALASLGRAVDLGWRRGWLMRRDPSFGDLRDDPRFESLLARIDEANAAGRRKIASSPAT